MTSHSVLKSRFSRRDIRAKFPNYSRRFYTFTAVSGNFCWVKGFGIPTQSPRHGDSRVFFFFFPAHVIYGLCRDSRVAMNKMTEVSVLFSLHQRTEIVFVSSIILLFVLVVCVAGIPGAGFYFRVGLVGSYFTHKSGRQHKRQETKLQEYSQIGTRLEQETFDSIFWPVRHGVRRGYSAPAYGRSACLAPG